jgi:transposase
MTVYCGVDFHARQQTVCYCDTADGEVKFSELKHNREEIVAFYGSLKGEVIVAIEATGYSRWFEELILGLGHQLLFGNPTLIRRRAPRKQKNDRRDAELILTLLIKGELPIVQPHPAESGEVLRQLRYRHKLVKVRTLAKNSLHNISISAGCSLQKSMLYKGRAKLEALKLPADLGQQRTQWLQTIERQDKLVNEVESWLEKKAANDRLVQLLQTHPGIGLISSMVIRHTLEPLTRFSTTRKVVAYAGLDPVEDSSGERKKFGSISKAGSRLLRFVLGQAGLVACRRDESLGRFYKRITAHRNHQTAKVAVARKLLVRAFIMMRDEIDYAEFIRRGVEARSARLTRRPAAQSSHQ